MSDNRFDGLTISEPLTSYDESVKIDHIKLTNYKFFHGTFEFPINGENVLIYGENGSGKSSIYKALKLLTQNNFTSLDDSLNIFANDGETTQVEFRFTNSKELIISSDLEDIPEHVDFIKGLSIFKPMLDYKKLLNVHYITGMNGDIINLYPMFRHILKDYPVEVNSEKKKLSEIRDFNIYFNTIESVLKEEFLSLVNDFLKKYFDAEIFIEKFEFKTEIDEDSSKALPIINLSIDYKENILEKYHTFLNEAKLSALAMSIYFVAIKKMLGTMNTNTLKILVLDDLLISLDMNNRMKLLEILKNEFSDFQIFFFTHDKELFEIYKNKMSWKKYELYLDESGNIPRAILKQGKSYIEQAKEYFAKQEYEACGLFLIKAFEKILKSYLTPGEQRDRNFVELDLAGLIGKAISKSDGEIKQILEKLNFDRQHIFNSLRHDDQRPVYSEELRSAIDDMIELKELLS